MMRKDLCCYLTIFVVLRSTKTLCGTTPCDEAKDWLREVGKEGLKNMSDVWNQLKPWVSGNEASCLKALLNETNDDDESNVKLSDVLRQYVFKEVTNSAPKQPGKKKKRTSRRPGNRNVRRNKKRNRNVGRQTPQNKTVTVTKMGKEVTAKGMP